LIYLLPKIGSAGNLRNSLSEVLQAMPGLTVKQKALLQALQLAQLRELLWEGGAMASGQEPPLE